MPAPIHAMNPGTRDAINLKIAKLKAMSKHAFVPSPQSQEQVQQQAQQTGQQPNQGPNAQAIGAAGITLDDVAQMIDQFYQESNGLFQQTQQQIMGLQQQINASAGEGDGKKSEGGKDNNLEARIAQLEQMLGGTGAVAGAAGPPTATPPPGAPQDPSSAMAGAPVPGMPAAPPPAAQQAQPPQQQAAPVPGA